MGKYPRFFFRGSLAKAEVLSCCLTQYSPSMFVWGTKQLHHKMKWLFRVSKRNWTRWWFQTCFIFIPTWGRFPFWLIFFRWVETTNQWNVILTAVTTFNSHFLFFQIYVRGINVKECNTKTHSKWNYCGECCSLKYLKLSYTSPEGEFAWPFTRKSNWLKSLHRKSPRSEVSDKKKQF